MVPLRTIFGGQVHILCDKFKCLILNTNGKVESEVHSDHQNITNFAAQEEETKTVF